MTSVMATYRNFKVRGRLYSKVCNFSGVDVIEYIAAAWFNEAGKAKQGRFGRIQRAGMIVIVRHRGETNLMRHTRLLSPFVSLRLQVQV